MSYSSDESGPLLSRTLFQIQIWNSLANNNDIQMNAYAKKR